MVPPMLPVAPATSNSMLVASTTVMSRLPLGSGVIPVTPLIPAKVWSMKGWGAANVRVMVSPDRLDPLAVVSA